MIAKKVKRHPARCFTFLILNLDRMVLKQLLVSHRKKKSRGVNQHLNPNATLEAGMCYSFKSSPMEKGLQLLKAKTSKTRAGFSGDISTPFSQVPHHPPRKLLVNQNTTGPTSLIAQSSQEDKAALSFLFYIRSCNTK